MKVLLTGSHGLIGSALHPALRKAGYCVNRLVRSGEDRSGDQFRWEPLTGQLDLAAFEGVEAVVHLAGENVAQRWTPQAKQRIVSSRTVSTRLLVDTMARLSTPPSVFIAASAIGYYGDRGDEELLEDSSPGGDFLAEVCYNWESAAAVAEHQGIRTVRLRIGVVLSRRGGALARMLTPFRMGLGGRIGSGAQYMSWIAIDDLVAAILHVLANPQLRGPVNAVSPHPVTNREFTETLGTVLRRFTIIPLPGFVVTLAFGEMGRELLLSSTRVLPAKLKRSNFQFQYSFLGPALRKLLT